MRPFLENGDIILDFFSGSCSTAEAVLRTNQDELKKANFIMVQIPEKTDENSEALKAGYKNICEIGKQRIRKVGGKLLAETSTNSHKNNLELFFSSAGASPKAVLLG